MSKELRYALRLFKQYQQLCLSIFVILGVGITLPVIVYRYNINFELYYMLLHIIVICVVVYILGYQYNRGTVDLYYSLPIKRNKLFFLHQIVGLIIILIPAITVYTVAMLVRSNGVSFWYLFYLLAEIITTYVIFSLLTTISNNYLDSLFLIGCYYIIPIVGFMSLFRFLNTALYGFYINREFFSKIFSYLTLVVFPHDDSINAFVYLLSFIIINTIAISFTYFFNYRRKVEQSGEKLSHPRIFGLINFVLIMIYLTFIVSDETSYYSILSDKLTHQLLSLINLSFPIAIGLIIYLGLGLIQKKKLINVVKYIINYCIMLVVYLGLLLVFLNVFRPMYEAMIPDNVQKVELTIDTYGSQNNIVVSKGNEEKLKLTDPQDIELVKEIHKDLINDRKSPFNSSYETIMKIKYTHYYVLPAYRRYNSKGVALAKLYQKDGPVYKKTAEDLKEILANEEDGIITFSDRAGKEALRLLPKDKLQKFLLYLLDHSAKAQYNDTEVEGYIYFSKNDFEIKIPIKLEDVKEYFN